MLRSVYYLQNDDSKFGTDIKIGNEIKLIQENKILWLSLMVEHTHAQINFQTILQSIILFLIGILMNRSMFQTGFYLNQ